MKVDHDTGEKTAYIHVTTNGDADIHLGWSSSNADLGAGGRRSGDTSLILETTVDTDGNLRHISLIKSGRTKDGENVRENLGITDAATHEGYGHRLQADLPITGENRAEMEQLVQVLTSPEYSG